MGIKSLLSKLIDKRINNTNVKNEDSNNIENFGNFAAASINNGYKEVNGSEINIATTLVNNNTLNIYIDAKENNEDKKITPLSKEIEEIKKMENYHFSTKAIDKYNELLIFNSDNVTAQDKFEIIINVLSIYINLHDKEHIEEYIKNLDRLTFKDEKRVAKVISIYYFNIREFQKVEEILGKHQLIPSESPQYIVDLAVRCINNKITYDEFKEMFLADDELKEEVKNGDIANLYNIIGYTAREKYEYDDLIKFSEKALELENSSNNKANLAMAYYTYSIKDSVENNKITNNRVHYEELVKAKRIIEDVIKLAEQERDINLFEYVMNLYVQILSLLGEITTALDTLQKLSFQHKDGTLKETRSILEYIFKGEDIENIENIKKLNESDILLKEINELIKSEKIKNIIDKLEMVIWSKYKTDLRFHCILLDSYLKEDEIGKFISHLKKVESLGIESNSLLKVKFDYYLKIDDFDNAEQCLIESIDKYKDPNAYYDLLSLYFKYDEDTRFKQLIEQIFNKDNFVLEIFYKEIYNIYFDWLFKKGLFLKAKKVIDKCDKNKYDIINYTNKSGIIHTEIGDYSLAIDIYKEGYNKTKASNYLYGLACSYMQCNELDRAKESLTKLLNTNFEKMEVVYTMLSNIEVLNNNLSGAFKYCEQAKKLVEDFPKSDIHSFYVMRSMRCDEVDSGVIHMNNFVENYPKIDNWVKTVHAIERDSNGNENLTEECKDFFEKLSDSFNNKLNQLKSGPLGLINMTKDGQTYDEVFIWKDIYNVKVNINSGNTEELQKEYSINFNKIVIDVVGLYILSDIGELDLLKNVKNVYITYSTLEYLNIMLLHRENIKVREILNFIKQNLNIKIVPINYKLYSEFEEVDKFLDKYILDSWCYAKQNNIAYYYGEFILKMLTHCYKINSIGIMSLLKKEKLENKAQIISKLRRKNYNFINFNYEDMYYCAKKNNFADCEEIECFFNIDEGGDSVTFIRHYLIFLYIIYTKHNEHFEDMYKLFIKSMSRLYNKTIYSVVISRTLYTRNGLYDNLIHFANVSKVSIGRKIVQDTGIISEKNINILKTNARIAIQYSYDFFKDKDEFKYYLNIIFQIVNMELFDKVKIPINTLEELNITTQFDEIVEALE